MTEPTGSTGPHDTAAPRRDRAHALAFGDVADHYDRARPTYPAEAAAWLVGKPAKEPSRGTSRETGPGREQQPSQPRRVLELGAGTGRLTEAMVGLGHRVLPTDPLPAMLRHLARRLPDTRPVAAVAERIPLPARSVDVVVAAQSFHWFDLDRALPEIARVLRPGGRLAVAWNLRDRRIPWVRRLDDLITPPERDLDPTQPLIASQLFGYVEQTTFRFWQRLDPDLIRDLALSGSHLAAMTETARERQLAAVMDLYAEYGRGHDGMLLPYLTRCYAATVRARAVPEEPRRPTAPPTEPPAGSDGGDDLLIDFS